MVFRETEQLIGTKPEELTKDDFMKKSASEPVPDNEKDVEAVPKNKLTAGNLGSNYSKLLFTSFTRTLL